MHLGVEKKTLFSLGLHYGTDRAVVLTCRVDACCGATGEQRGRSLGVALPPAKEMAVSVAPRADIAAMGKAFSP